jgi:hypothetical protein
LRSFWVKGEKQVFAVPRYNTPMQVEDTIARFNTKQVNDVNMVRIMYIQS